MRWVKLRHMPSASWWCCSSSWCSIFTGLGGPRVGPHDPSQLLEAASRQPRRLGDRPDRDFPADLDGDHFGQAPDRAVSNPCHLLADRDYLRTLPDAPGKDRVPKI